MILSHSLAVLVSAALVSGSAFAEVLVSEEGRFSVETPKTEQLHYQWADRKTGRSWYVGSRQLPTTDTPASSALIEKTYDVMVQAVIDSSKGTLIIQRPIHLGEVTGREIVVKSIRGGKTIATRHRMLNFSGLTYHVVYSGPMGSETDPNVEAFFNSFKIRLQQQDKTNLPPLDGK